MLPVACRTNRWPMRDSPDRIAAIPGSLEGGRESIPSGKPRGLSRCRIRIVANAPVTNDSRKLRAGKVKCKPLSVGAANSREFYVSSGWADDLGEDGRSPFGRLIVEECQTRPHACITQRFFPGTNNGASDLIAVTCVDRNRTYFMQFMQNGIRISGSTWCGLIKHRYRSSASNIDFLGCKSFSQRK
jgi:hypothetical protein